MTSSKMDILPTINPAAGAASGAADTPQKGPRPGGDGSFADMLSSANAKADAGKGKSAKTANDKGSTSATGRTGAEGATEPGNAGNRGAGRTAARPAETTGGTIAGVKSADGTVSEQSSGTTVDGSAGAAGLAGAMLNSVVGAATGDKPTSPITDAVLGSGAVAGGPKPQPGAPAHAAAGTPPATTDAASAAQPATAVGATTATGTATPGAGTGATSPNLVMTPDGEPADAAASATLLAAADSGKSTPGKANSLVTGSSDVVTAKTALRTGALDPTAMAKDAKSPGAGTVASDAAAPSLANNGDANAAGNARTLNQAAVDSAAARTQRPDAVKADSAAAPGAPATPTDIGASQNTVATSTAAAAIAGTDATSPAHHTAHAAATRAMPGPAPVFDQIALNIHRAAAEGLDRITIQLKPESLGRVDVHLQLGHDGRMTATFVADRQDTLDMLQRDARGLERALNDAGLRTDTGGLSFNLRGDGREFGNPAQNMGQGTHDGSGEGGADADTTAESARPERVINGLLDISV